MTSVIFLILFLPPKFYFKNLEFKKYNNYIYVVTHVIEIT
jgi:hypothetical protein